MDGREPGKQGRSHVSVRNAISLVPLTSASFGLSDNQKIPFQDGKWPHKVQVREKLGDGTFSAPLGKESPLEKRVREKWEAKQRAKKDQEEAEKKAAEEEEKACGGDVEMTDAE